MISVRNKWLSILGVLMILMLIVDVGYSHAWLYYYTPAFKGRITDATTGAPIENVIIEVSWVKEIPGIGDKVASDIAVEAFPTDKNGEYYIPSKISIHILSWFDRVIFYVRHPLYETKHLSWGKEEIDHLKNGEWQHKAEISGEIDYAKVDYQDGVIKYDLQLLSLAEKFKEKASFGGAKPLGSEILDNGVEYFSLAKGLNISVDYVAIFREWDRIAERFKDDEGLHTLLRMAKRKIEPLFKGEKSEK